MRRLGLIILFIPVLLFGAFEYIPGGVRFQTMGYTGTAINNDVGAIYTNPAAIADINDLIVSTAYERRLNIFDMIDIRAALPISIGKVAIGIEYMPAFGDQTDINGDVIETSTMLGSETAISFFWALSNEYFDIGVGSGFYSYSTAISDNDPGVGFNIGMHKKIYNRVDIGLAINNLLFYPMASQMNTYDYRLPMEVRGGISYRPVNDLLVSLDFSRIDGYPVSIATGAEYVLSDILYLRSGIISYPLAIITGFGISYNKFIINYGFDWTAGPGASHKIELGIKL